MTSRLPQIFGQIKPDTIGFWETVFGVSGACFIFGSLIHVLDCRMS